MIALSSSYHYSFDYDTHALTTVKSYPQLRPADQVCYARSAWDTPPDPVFRSTSMLPGLPPSAGPSQPPTATAIIINPQPISFRLPHVPHAVPPSPATPAPAFAHAPTAGDFSSYLKENYPKLVSQSTICFVHRVTHGGRVYDFCTALF